MLTLGFDAPNGLARQLLSFAAAGVGLTLFALVIAYIPTVYAAFSRREALITKLVVRVGAPPTGPTLLGSTWRLARFEHSRRCGTSGRTGSSTSANRIRHFRSWHSFAHRTLKTIGFWLPKPCSTGPLCLRRSVTFLASPAASCVFMPEFTRWRRSRTFWGFRIIHRNPRPRSHFPSNGSPRAATSSAISACRCARIALAPGLNSGPRALAMSRCWR
jgi:hypothetical protein